jgi:hypothetical protein
LSGLVVSGEAAAVGPTLAAQTTFKQKQEAQAAFKQGKAAKAKGDWATALQAFQSADGLHPGAAPKYEVAVCYDKLNKHAEAAAAYRTFIDSKPGAKYADRVVAAGQRIAELEKLMITKVTFAVTPPNLGGMSITVDGEPIQGTELDLKPGEHTVVVTAPNHVSITEIITVRAGEPLSVPVTLVAEATVPVGDTVGDTVDDSGGDDGMALKIAGFSLVGVGVAAGVVSGVFGVMALGSASDFEATPTEELADDTESQGLLADVFLGVGGAFAIGGAILLYFGFTADGEEAVVASPIPAMQPWAGPHGAGTMATWKF